MLNALKTFLICALVTTLVLLMPATVAQVRKRLICGKVMWATAPITRTEVSLYFSDNSLLPGTATEADGTFCIENYVSDPGQTTSARLYVASICHPDDLTLVDVPFWPQLRREAQFSGKRVIVGPGSITNVGNVGVQVIYGHISLRILDQRYQPLLTEAGEWSPIWIRVRDQKGVTVHESGLSIADIERSVDLKESRINLALPEGQWRLEVALAGVPPNTGTVSRAVIWQRVPEQVRVESCRGDVEVNLLVRRTKALTKR